MLVRTGVPAPDHAQQRPAVTYTIKKHLVVVHVQPEIWGGAMKRTLDPQGQPFPVSEDVDSSRNWAERVAMAR